MHAEPQVAVITGAGSGIGATTFERLAAQGWTVIGLDRSFGPGLSEGGPNRFRLHCDVADAASVDEAFGAISARFGKIRALVAAAGVLRVGALATMAVADFDQIFQVNTRGAWLCARAAIPQLAPRSETAPAIIFIGSVGGLRPKIGNGAYSAQKAALHVLCGVLAAELGPKGILVNAIAPGTVDTPMIHAMADGSKTGKFRPSGLTPLGRIASPEDIADAVELLLDHRSGFITGVILPVDGGTRAAFVPAQVTVD